MAARTIFANRLMSVFDYRCTVAPGAVPYVEAHDRHSVSYVRKGSFGYRSGGRAFDLVAGAAVIGRPGAEYVCTHDHVHGDECLSFQFAPALAEELGGKSAVWRTGAVPPLPALMVLGELGQSAAAGASDAALDEVGIAGPASLFVSPAVRSVDGLLRIEAPLAEVLRLDVADVQKAVAAHAKIDERRLNARLQVNHPALVDVPHVIVLAGALDVELLQHSVLNDRNPAFFRLRHVDQHFLLHNLDSS